MVDQGKLGIDELTEEEYWEVYNVNQHECFDSNANRFMGDLYCERKYGNAH